MFDVFYFGPKPDLFPHERYAESIDDAAILCRTTHFWYIDGSNDYTGFDFRYKPVPWEQDFVHTWPNQWQQDGGVYLASSTVNSLTMQQHYHLDQPVHRLPDMSYWHIPEWIDPASIDTRWCPDPCDPPLVYHFPVEWGWDKHSGPEYRVPGATGDKFETAFVAKTRSDRNNWTVSDTVSNADPTFNWHPDPSEPPYIYVFGNQWYPPEVRESARYTVPGASELKFVTEPRFTRLADTANYKTLYNCEWDYSWEPDPGDPPYIYEFGNQWYPPEIMSTIEYAVPGATERKFMEWPKAVLPEQHNNRWHTIVDCEWDYSWVPDPGDPPYIYVFGNQWHSAEIMPTVTYTVPGATEQKFMDAPIARLLADKTNWTIPEEIVVANIDFSWVPDPGSPAYIYHFGTEYQESVGLLYTVPGATEIRLEGPAPKVEKEKTAVDVLDIFFIDKGNPTAQSRYDVLVEQYPTAQKVRYANSMLATIQRCIARAKTHKFWIISSEYYYGEFDFHWHAQSWQSYMTHVFPSQHNKWSDTFLINKHEFQRHTKWAKSLEEFPNLNFVTNQQVLKTDNLWDIYYVDHSNPESDSQFRRLREQHPDIIKTRHANDYLSVLKRIMATANTEYVWVLNSVCDYSKFDFSWQPEPWQKEMIHCFANENGDWGEKRGDTFYIHVESFKNQMVELEMLDWFNVINYVETQDVERWPVPIIEYNSDNLVQAIKDYEFTTPYAVFANREFGEDEKLVDCLWTEKDRWVRPLSTSSGISIIPRDIKKYLKTQIYDYPHLWKYEKGLPFNYYMDQVLDVVYISNGEPDAERWYDHLKTVLEQMNSVAFLPRFSNKLHRVENVNGRVAAYQAAANVSTTPWFFAVFAKLEVDSNFNFNWQPDYWQEPKHYIFNAKNPVNGLEYGHMGMIAYNKRLVLENNDPGIDFTLSQLHESVPLLSGTAHFNQDPWTTWRTAFREVLKLRMFMESSPTLETEHRLNTWCTNGDGKYSELSCAGAKDALEYYESVNGDPAKLQLSFEWAWLKQQFDAKYKL